VKIIKFGRVGLDGIESCSEVLIIFSIYEYTTFVTGLAGLQHQGLESEYIGESKATELRG
jgi:hypothetical protein